MNARGLLDAVVEHDELAELDAAQRRLALRSILAAHVDEAALGVAVRTVADEIDGYGPVTSLMSDPEVTDVLINAWDKVWIEARGNLVRTDLSFEDAGHLRDFTTRLLLRCGGRADRTSPICDARLPDGTRLHVVVPPIALGPTISLRKFPADPLTLTELRALGMIDAQQLDVLSSAVALRKTMCICGATGSGKTTLLNALLGLIPPYERVVVVEQARELRPACAHAVTLVSVPDNQEGIGGVELEALVRAALRMRPDRIVVGEVRGPEALPALNALSTGHQGSMVTVHAGSVDEARRRIADLAAIAARSPIGTFAETVRSSFDVVIYLRRTDGVRRVSAIVGS